MTDCSCIKVHRESIVPFTPVNVVVGTAARFVEAASMNIRFNLPMPEVGSILVDPPRK